MPMDKSTSIILVADCIANRNCVNIWICYVPAYSAIPTSLAMTDLVEGTRKYVLRYFSASPDEYIAIFTANASGALKLVGEAYPYTHQSLHSHLRQSQLRQWHP